MNQYLHSRDIAGNTLSPHDYCLVTQNNRIILAQVIKVSGSAVTVQPVNSSAGQRRNPPPLKPLRRNSYNVYRIPSQEITMSILKGAV